MRSEVSAAASFTTLQTWMYFWYTNTTGFSLPKLLSWQVWCTMTFWQQYSTCLRSHITSDSWPFVDRLTAAIKTHSSRTKQLWISWSLQFTRVDFTLKGAANVLWCEREVWFVFFVTSHMTSHRPVIQRGQTTVHLQLPWAKFFLQMIRPNLFQSSSPHPLTRSPAPHPHPHLLQGTRNTSAGCGSTLAPIDTLTRPC